MGIGKFSWNNSLLSDSCARGSQLIFANDCLSYTLTNSVTYSVVILIPSFLYHCFIRNQLVLSYFLKSCCSIFFFFNIYISLNMQLHNILIFHYLRLYFVCCSYYITYSIVDSLFLYEWMWNIYSTFSLI